MSKPTAFIDNWQIMGNSLIGEVSEHPRQAEFEKERQVTSQVVRIKVLEGFSEGATVETENTIYTLGTEYEP